MQWTLSPKTLAMPSTRCLFSVSVFCLVALQLLSFSTTQISALRNPNNNRYYALFREESAQASPYYRLFAPGSEEVSQEKRDVPMAIGKNTTETAFSPQFNACSVSTRMPALKTLFGKGSEYP